MRNKNKVEGPIFSYFKPYYKAIIINSMFYWHKARCTDQGKIIESWEMDPFIYGKLISDKGITKRSVGDYKITIFSTKNFEKPEYPYVKEWIWTSHIILKN